MDDYSEESDHAFIIRIWKEKREIQGVSPIWRGVIEHVPTGKRRYLQDLAHIITFLTPYFEEMGLKTSIFWQWAVRIRKLKYSFQRPSISNPPDPEIETND
jgi:hypothetical protein